MIGKKARFFVIDAYQVARETGMGKRMNTIMQVCFFAISPKFCRATKPSKPFATPSATLTARRAMKSLQQNLRRRRNAGSPFRSEVAAKPRAKLSRSPAAFLHAGARSSSATCSAPSIRARAIRTSRQRFPVDGTFPTGTAKWEKRNHRARDSGVGYERPLHPVRQVRDGLPARRHSHQGLRRKSWRCARNLQVDRSCATKNGRGSSKYTIQVSPEDCTGCGICVDVCPVKNKSETRLKAINMVPQPPLRAAERENWDFFLKIPELDRRKIKITPDPPATVQEPLFEFSGACSGCGETPYLKLVSQLFGDRSVIANATGCSSIYGGNLPTTPWSKNADGRGPAWSNSLFEDNAEFGLGIRVAIDKQTEFARELLQRLGGSIGDQLVAALADQRKKTRPTFSSSASASTC
jgi:pyruvate-ferredoxin/flavodoxin oxidoreductase